jgi:hypothetical protein
MVTSIETATDIVISDNATPANGTYAWYIASEQVTCAWQKEPFSWIATAAGISIGVCAYKLNLVWNIKDTVITSLVHYDNLLDALHYWEANNTLLYLSFKNTWGTNLAQYRAKATPTTAAQMQGRLRNFKFVPQALQVVVSCEMYFCSS